MDPAGTTVNYFYLFLTAFLVLLRELRILTSEEEKDEGRRLWGIPTAGALQVLVKEVWQATAPDQPQESPVHAAEPADESGDPVAQHRPHPTVQAGDLN